ncbi:MAG: hypothetical protein J7639_20630, partial [Paenibacillaceae bacterium]|nr:hypothetical protein [Paenibacillaceae bacterium]
MKKLTYKKFTKKISNTKQQLINLLTLPDKLNSLESKLESKLQSKLESINSTLQLLDAKMRLLDTKMEQIVSEHLEQKLTDTITASQNQNDLNLIFNSISDKFSKLIIAKEQILPEKGLENRQAHLIMRLSDKSNEFAAYNQLPIETLISYADGKTAVSCHYINVFNSFAKENGIEICDGGMIAAELPMRLAGTDTLIVSNPVMSALILSTPSLLAELARKLSKRLILAVRVSNEIISTTWDGFSEVEETERIYRWAEGSSRTARIQLNNSTNEPVR